MGGHGTAAGDERGALGKEGGQRYFQITGQVTQHAVLRLARAAIGVNPAAAASRVDDPHTRNSKSEVIVDLVPQISGPIFGRENFHCDFRGRRDDSGPRLCSTNDGYIWDAESFRLDLNAYFNTRPEAPLFRAQKRGQGGLYIAVVDFTGISLHEDTFEELSIRMENLP